MASGSGRSGGRNGEWGIGGSDKVARVILSEHSERRTPLRRGEPWTWTPPPLQGSFVADAPQDDDEASSLTLLGMTIALHPRLFLNLAPARSVSRSVVRCPRRSSFANRFAFAAEPWIVVQLL